MIFLKYFPWKLSKNFLWNCIFDSFKLFPSSKIDFWPFLKLKKKEFGQKNFVKLIYLISRPSLCPKLVKTRRKSVFILSTINSQRFSSRIKRFNGLLSRRLRAGFLYWSYWYRRQVWISVSKKTFWRRYWSIHNPFLWRASYFYL